MELICKSGGYKPTGFLFINDDLKANFQAGVDTLYNKCVSCGATPSSKTPTAISNAIQKIYNDRYTSGYNKGVTDGRVGYYTKVQYDANYTTGYNAGYAAGRAQGQADVIANPSAYGIQTGYTIEQIQADIQLVGWSDIGNYTKRFTAPTKGKLVIGNEVFSGAGVIYHASGTHHIKVTYRGSVIKQEDVATWGQMNQSGTNPYTIIPAGTQYELNAGESLDVYARFEGSWWIAEGGPTSSGNCNGFDGKAAIVWARLYV